MEVAVEGPVAGNEAFTVRVVSGGEEPHYVRPTSAHEIAADLTLLLQAVHYIVSKTGEYTRDVVLPLERIRRYRAEVSADPTHLLHISPPRASGVRPQASAHPPQYTAIARRHPSLECEARARVPPWIRRSDAGLTSRAQVLRQVPGLALPELPGWDRKQKRRRKLAKREFRDELASYFAQLLAHPLLSCEPEVLALLLRMDAPASTATDALVACIQAQPASAVEKRAWAKDEKEKRVNFEALLDSLALDISAVADQDQFRLGRSCGSLLMAEDSVIHSDREPETPSPLAKEDAASRKEWNPVRFFRKPREKASSKKVLTSTSIDVLGTVPGPCGQPPNTVYRVLDHVAVLSNAYHLVKATDPSGALVLLKVQLPTASTRTAPLELEYETMLKVRSLFVWLSGVVGVLQPPQGVTSLTWRSCPRLECAWSQLASLVATVSREHGPTSWAWW